jgi:hypothetical protein
MGSKARHLTDAKNAASSPIRHGADRRTPDRYRQSSSDALRIKLEFSFM